MERKGHLNTARHIPAAEGGPEIKSIPLYGATWYTGGPAYWLRRALVSLVLLAFLGVFAGLVAFFVSAIFWGSPSRKPDLGPGFTFLGIVIVATIVSFVWTWRRIGRMETDVRERVKDLKEGLIFGTAWSGLGWVVVILVVVGAVAGGVVRRSVSAAIAVLVGLALFGLATFGSGGMLAVFVKSLLEEPRTVRLARQEVDDWYRERGLDSRGSIRPT